MSNEPPYTAASMRPRRPSPSPGPTAAEAPVTVALLAANFGIFALEERWGGSDDPETLLRMGAISTHGHEAFHWGNLFAYGYLHIGIVHVAVNMLALFNLGRALEPILGSARLFVLYTASLLGGGLAIRLGSHADVVAGASGALFGLLGSVSVLLAARYRRTQNLLERAMIRRQLLTMYVPNLIISLLPGVSFLGHAGGLVIGIVFVARSLHNYVEDPSDEARARRARGMTFAAIACALVTVAAIASVWSTTRPWIPRPAAEQRVGSGDDSGSPERPTARHVNAG